MQHKVREEQQRFAESSAKQQQLELQEKQRLIEQAKQERLLKEEAEKAEREQREKLEQEKREKEFLLQRERELEKEKRENNKAHTTSSENSNKVDVRNKLEGLVQAGVLNPEMRKNPKKTKPVEYANNSSNPREGVKLENGMVLPNVPSGDLSTNTSQDSTESHLLNRVGQLEKQLQKTKEEVENEKLERLVQTKLEEKERER